MPLQFAPARPTQHTTSPSQYDDVWFDVVSFLILSNSTFVRGRYNGEILVEDFAFNDVFRVFEEWLSFCFHVLR